MTAATFATPVAHRTTADYQAFAGALLAGRPFRQPLAAPDATHADGMEIFLSSAPGVATVFAAFPGRVLWTPAADSTGTLELAIDTLTVKALRKLPTVEAPPARLQYANLEASTVRAALIALLERALGESATAKRSSWHPSMTLVVGRMGSKKPIPLNDELARDPGAEIAALVDDFMRATGTIPEGLPLLPGDAIGEAAAYRATDTLPPAPPVWMKDVGDADRARRLTLRAFDAGEQSVDPVYYLYSLFRNALGAKKKRHLEPLTKVTDGAALAHPLVTAFPALGVEAPPPARLQGVPSGLPIGKLSEFHTSSYYVKTPSRYEWRLSDVGFLELRPTGTAGLPELWMMKEAEVSRLAELWKPAAPDSKVPSRGDVVRRACELLQVPCELVMAILVSESRNARDIRFEPLKDPSRKALRDAGRADDEDRYDDLVGLRGTAGEPVRTANGGTTLAVTLDRKVSTPLPADLLLRYGRSERARILSSSKSETATANVTLSISEPVVRGSSGRAIPHRATLYFAPSVPGIGQERDDGLRKTFGRTTTARRLEVKASKNTLDGPTVVTLLVDGTESKLQVVLDSKETSASSTLSVNVKATDALSVAVASGGTHGEISGLSWSFELAATAGEVFVLLGRSSLVPVLWRDDELVSPAHELTWGDVKTLIRLIPDRISPGAMQTIVSTALAQMNEVLQWFPGYFEKLGLAAPDASEESLLTSLVQPEISIALGIAYLRSLYRIFPNRFDLPALAACYNRGRLKGRKTLDFGLYFYANSYLENAIPAYNSAVSGFRDGSLKPAPTVVFAR